MPEALKYQVYGDGYMKTRKIMVVDDEPNLLLAVTLTLRRAGFDVIPAGNGTYAFDLLLQAERAREPMDLLITDLHLPGISGIDLIEKVRRSGSTMKIAVITAYGNTQMRMDLEKIGTFFCLDKPFNIEELLYHVYTALGEPVTRGNFS